MIVYYLVFCLLVILFILVKTGKLNELTALLSIALVLILIAGLRKPGIDRDSVNYINIFESFGSPAQYFSGIQQNIFFEPFYYLIPSVLVFLGLNSYYTFIIFAFIAIAVKLLAIRKLTDLVLLSVIVYFGHFFILHEMTQMRAGVASGIVLLSIVQAEQRRLVNFLGLILLGAMFHYSIVIFIPFYFLGTKDLNKKLYLTLLYVPYVLYVLDINILTILQRLRLGVISDKLQLYNDLFEKGDDSAINVFNALFLIQLVLCTVFILKNELVYAQNKYAILLIKIYTISASVFVLFSSIPIVAFRLSELLQIVQIILIPFLLYLVRPYYAALFAIIAFALMIMTVDLFYAELLKPYELGF